MIIEQNNMADNASPVFAITRVLDAPRLRVWEAWTEARHLAHWWGPKGCTIRVQKLDLRPGGTFHYAMQFPNDVLWWGRFVFRDIAAPERLVFVNSFSDADAGLTRPPFNMLFPLEVLNTLTLSEENGKTTLSLRGGPINATQEERDAYVGMFPSMRIGFGATFDQLAAYLANA